LTSLHLKQTQVAKLRMFARREQRCSIEKEMLHKKSIRKTDTRITGIWASLNAMAPDAVAGEETGAEAAMDVAGEEAGVAAAATGGGDAIEARKATGAGDAIARPTLIMAVTLKMGIEDAGAIALPTAGVVGDATEVAENATEAGILTVAEDDEKAPLVIPKTVQTEMDAPQLAAHIPDRKTLMNKEKFI